jgi:hypothetical protein
MYIITYATHTERYLTTLKESCPDLVVLGYGKKWKGLGDKVLATLEFCRQHPDDIICFIDGFDSVVLSSKDEILQKYKSLQTPLVMSHGAKGGVFLKYMQDKVFGKCKNIRLNSGMFIGTSESIIEFWKDYKYGNDQTYATQQCKKFNMKIDVNHDIFYNYSSYDDIVVKNDKLYVNGIETCVISCPGNSNINPYLKQLGYSPPEIEINYKDKINTYLKAFLPEMIVFLFACICFCTCSFPIAIGVSILLFTTLVEYELNIKHYPISMFYKMICLQVDLLHVVVWMTFGYLMLNFTCNMKKLVLLNTFYLIVVLCFYFFKRCILTIIPNQLTNTNFVWTAPDKRLQYFFDLDKQYLNGKKDDTNMWMDLNKLACFTIICLNLYCYSQLYSKNERIYK